MIKQRLGRAILQLCQNKRQLKNGLYPIYIRVQYKTQNRYYSTYCEMSHEDWDRFEKCPDKNHPSMITYKQFSTAIEKMLMEDSFSFRMLSQLTERGHKDTIQELIENCAEEFRKDGKWNTANLYHNLRVCIDEFAGKQVPTLWMNEEKCKQFLAWLGTKKGNGTTTISIKARTLTAVLNRAVKRHQINKNPMNGIKKPQYKRRDMSVSKESLHKLLTADEKQLGNELYWLQFWRASYYGNGINIADLLLLRPENINKTNNEINFVRKKTENSSGVTTRIALIPELADALNAICSEKGKYLIPILNDIPRHSRQEYVTIRQTIKNINTHMAKICQILDIPEKITTGTGRHCFATVLQQQQVPIEFISQAMGHTSIRTTQHYLDGYTKEQRVEKALLLKI